MSTAMAPGPSREELRQRSLYVIVAVAIFLIAGVAWHLTHRDTSATVLWIFAILVLACLAYQVWLLLAESRARKAHATPEVHAGPSATPATAAAAAETMAPPPATTPASEAPGEILTLKCGQCGTIFDVPDPGTRPLYHSCPGCGAQGVLEAPPEIAAPERAPLPPPEPAPAPAAAPRKNIKLRCGGCGHVFSVEDTGERPLRHRCPSCKRLGEIK